MRPPLARRRIAGGAGLHGIITLHPDDGADAVMDVAPPARAPMVMPRMQRLVALLYVAFAFTAPALGAAPEPGSLAQAPRQRLLLDFGWKFHLGDDWGSGRNLSKAASSTGPANPAFSDASWRAVDLPHDWAVELPFDARGDGGHGWKALGAAFPQNSVAWYRRTFTLPTGATGRRLWLEFDGVYRDAIVFVNGWFVGHHESGYSGFRYDITDVAESGGPNVVTVRVDATENEGWFYEGAGIYRHTWLVETGPVAVAPEGIFVRGVFAHDRPGGPARVAFETRLVNAASTPSAAEVAWTVLDPEGRRVATVRRPAAIPAGGIVDLTGAASVAAPVLWSPESPRLYQLVTTVERDGRVLDRITTPFGLRTFAFDPARGFLLNGHPYALRGTCNHQDHAGVGTALPDRLQAFRLERLKEMGSNAYRTAHNPPTPELLDAADRLGMLVMDESRLLGSDAANLERLENLVRRDRNHASVAIWSLGNEEFAAQGTPSGKRAAVTMQTLIKRLDPTRPVTYNSTAGNEQAGVNEAIEVRGWSYRIGVDRMDAYHAAHPDQPNVGSEQGSTLSTRGVYSAEPDRCTVSAYDDNKTDWSNTAAEWTGFFGTRPWLSGGFVWTGFDYRGEPTPYERWPCVSSQFGVLDTSGFPKDNFWLYQSWWTKAPMVHLLPHWNWSGREGHDIDVRAYSNTDEVELLLDGRSLGRRQTTPFGDLRWKVKYAPGTLAARAYRAGNVVAETRVETTGPAAAVRLLPDRALLNADGEDIAIVTAAVVDGAGRVVPTAGVPLSFSLAGPARIVGVGNGDPASHEPDVFVTTAAPRVRAIDGWRWKQIADPYAEAIPEAAPGVDTAAWQAVDVHRPSGPLGPGQRALFRATLTVSAAELAAHAVELRFARIEGDGRVFVNGKRVGSSGDARVASLFDVKALLRPGPNIVAVALSNYGATAGINGGVELRLQDQSAAPAWSRRTFNGLAQIIVRMGKQPGAIALTVRAPGLTSAILPLTSLSVSARPNLP